VWWLKLVYFSRGPKIPLSVIFLKRCRVYYLSYAFCSSLFLCFLSLLFLCFVKEGCLGSSVGFYVEQLYG